MKKVSLSEKALMVLNFLKEHADENYTLDDLTSELGFASARSTNGVIVAGLQNKGYAVRVPAQIEKEDGTVETVKFIKLTPEGQAYDHEAALKADAAASQKVEEDE